MKKFKNKIEISKIFASNLSQLAIKISPVWKYFTKVDDTANVTCVTR